MASERATWPVALAVNRIHHPDEPDGVRTRDVADRAGRQSDSPSGRAGWSPNARCGQSRWPSVGFTIRTSRMASERATWPIALDASQEERHAIQEGCHVGRVSRLL